MDKKLQTALQHYGIITDDMTISELVILIEMFMIFINISKIMWLGNYDDLKDEIWMY